MNKLLSGLPEKIYTEVERLSNSSDKLEVINWPADLTFSGSGVLKSLKTPIGIRTVKIFYDGQDLVYCF